jgi:hypothetical protein
MRASRRPVTSGVSVTDAASMYPYNSGSKAPNERALLARA